NEAEVAPPTNGTDDNPVETNAAGAEENGNTKDDERWTGEDDGGKAAGTQETNKDEEEAKVSDDDEKEEPRRDRERLVTIRFESDPSGATVDLNRRSCKTPCKLKVKRGNKVRATVSKRGYQSKSVRV